jgi:hypothetical protein
VQYKLFKKKVDISKQLIIMPPQNISTHTTIIQPNNPSIATQNSPHKEKYSITLTQTQRERLGFRERKREMRVPASGLNSEARPRERGAAQC